ncbi:MAG: metal-dependent transcriptional regulator [Candidatus Hodarchaeota archaeon]
MDSNTMLINRNEEILRILLEFKQKEGISLVPTQRVFERFKNTHSGQVLKYTAFLNHINRNMIEWVTFIPYHGLELTEKGHNHALKLVRKFKLAESLLIHVLHLDKRTARKEACRLEHGLSPLVTTQIEKILNN